MYLHHEFNCLVYVMSSYTHGVFVLLKLIKRRFLRVCRGLLDGDKKVRPGALRQPDELDERPCKRVGLSR